MITHPRFLLTEFGIIMFKRQLRFFRCITFWVRRCERDIMLVCHTKFNHIKTTMKNAARFRKFTVWIWKLEIQTVVCDFKFFRGNASANQLFHLWIVIYVFHDVRFQQQQRATGIEPVALTGGLPRRFLIRVTVEIIRPPNTCAILKIWIKH